MRTKMKPRKKPAANSINCENDNNLTQSQLKQVSVL